MLFRSMGIITDLKFFPPFHDLRVHLLKNPIIKSRWKISVNKKKAIIGYHVKHYQSQSQIQALDVGQPLGHGFEGHMYPQNP